LGNTRAMENLVVRSAKPLQKKPKTCKNSKRTGKKGERVPG